MTAGPDAGAPAPQAPSPPGQDSVTVRAADQSVTVVTQRGELDEASQHLKKALQIGQQDNQRGATGNSVQRRTREEADTLKNLAIAYRKGGHYVEAGRLLVDVLDIHRANNDLAGQANALNNHGIVYRLMGNHDTSERTHLEAQELYQKIGDRRGEADNLKNLGIAYREAGFFDAAITAHKSVVEIFEALGDRKGLANALNNLGINYREAGDLAEAHRTFEQARALYQGLGAGGEGPDIVRQALAAPTPPKPKRKRTRKKRPPKKP